MTIEQMPNGFIWDGNKGGLEVGLSRATVDILQTIQRNRVPISKAEIARLAGLSFSTVSEHTEALLRENLIVETATGRSTGGRRPQLLAFNAGAGYIATIDLESTHLQVGIADFGCTLLAVRSEDIDVAAGPFAVLQRTRDLLFALLDERSIDHSLIRAVGMGVPGPVEFSTGLPASLPVMPGWEGYPIRDFWARHLACPCYVDNNVNTMAIGEHAVGLGYSPDSLIFIKPGNGIGAGVICDGRIYRGVKGCAGHIGHIDVGDEVHCYCGHRGCLEAVAGGRAIIARAVELARDGRSPFLSDVLSIKGKLTVQDICLAIQAGDTAVVALIRIAGNRIGRVLASLIDFFNPHLVCIGGGFSQVGDVLLAAIRQAVYERSLPLATRSLAIEFSKLGETVGMVGAATMAIDEVILGLCADLKLAVPGNRTLSAGSS